MSGDARQRLAAVWFADLVEYTELSARAEEAAVALARLLQEVARETVDRHRGRLVKGMGDAVLAEFESVRDAVAAALALPPAYAARAETEDRIAPQLRVGVHVGEVTRTPDGDLYGDGINLASRIQTAARPGQVLVSEDVARHLRRRREFRLEPVGTLELKGMPEPVPVFEARPPGAAPAAPARAPAASIAVLPFANLSADPANEFFSDGITEEILTSLAQIEGLKVISRTTAMRYKGADKSLRQIGAELGVASVLEGSVRKAGDRVRITAQLVNARTDEHLWAERYDRDLEDIFAIQSDVADRIARALRVRLTAGERSRLSGHRTADVEAYQEYLRGLHFWNRRSREDLERSCRCFQKAIERDPEFAAAHAGVALAKALLPIWDEEQGDRLAEEGRAAAERALAIDPELSDAHAALAQIHLLRWEWEAAEREFRRALELNPGDATARQWYGHYLASVGRFEEALEELERARGLDPLSLPVVTEAGNVHLLARRFDDAARLYREALELDPTFVPARFQLAEIYYLTNRHEDAISEWERAGVLTREDADTARAALQEGSVAYLEGMARMAPEKGAPDSYMASIYGRLGRLDEGFASLERAYDGWDVYLTTLAVNPLFDPLRGDPRFDRMLERTGLSRVTRVDSLVDGGVAGPE